MNQPDAMTSLSQSALNESELRKRLPHNPADPDPWLALLLESSNPIEPEAKAALIRSNASWSRRFLFPIALPLSRLGIALVKLFRIVLPRWPHSSRLLHLSIYYGLKTFVSPEANTLILRHFHIGTQNLQFIASNIPGVSITTTKPLRPRKLEDLIDDTFLIHDLNIFNFVIELNQQVKEKGIRIEPPEQLDFSAIEDGPIALEPLPNKWHNVLDLHSAIEIYTPLYALFLSNDDFWRASNSLQLDQVVATYFAKILGRPELLSLVNNKHPMIPSFILSAAYRLMLHGHDAEALYGVLRLLKQTKQVQQPEPAVV